MGRRPDATNYEFGEDSDPVVTHSNNYHSVLLFWFVHGSKLTAGRRMWGNDDNDNLPEAAECGMEINSASHFVCHGTNVLATTSRNRRFAAFLGSCDNGIWCHTATMSQRCLAEALLFRRVFAVVAATDSVKYTSDSDIDYANEWTIQEIGYRFAHYVTKTSPHRYFVGEAFFTAAAPGDEAPPVLDMSDLLNILHLNLLGDPRSRIKNNI